jgi:hypothetical protein
VISSATNYQGHVYLQAQLWARKQAAATRPPSDTASEAAAAGNGDSGGPAGDQRERVDATPVADLLSDVRHQALSCISPAQPLSIVFLSHSFHMFSKCTYVRASASNGRDLQQFEVSSITLLMVQLYDHSNVSDHQQHDVESDAGAWPDAR